MDTGHLNLSALSVEDILNLPYEVTCLHLHSNDGVSDQHQLLTRRNFTDWKYIEELLTSDKYIVMELKGEIGINPQVLDHLRQQKIPN